MSTYLVTGGAGFIGSNLADALLSEGHAVRILDNLSTGKKENVPTDAEFIQGDITDLASMRSAFEGIDGVFHCAADPRLPFSIEHPEQTHKTNLEGTLNVLLAARDAKVKRVVFSSSAAVYGNQATSPQTLDLIPKPLSPYGLEKFAGEHYARLFAELYGLETVSLRYFNAYGPRMSNVGAYVPVFMIFLKQRAEGKPLTILGDGEQTRDFVHVSDIVQANMKAMTSSSVGKGEVFNVGVGEETTVNRIAELIGGDVTHAAARVGDIRSSCADISMTRELLGYEPKVRFEDGLRALLHGSEMK